MQWTEDPEFCPNDDRFPQGVHLLVLTFLFVCLFTPKGVRRRVGMTSCLINEIQFYERSIICVAAGET